jgi:hypothetical protein
MEVKGCHCKNAREGFAVVFGGFEDRSADMTECLRLPPHNAPQNAESKAKIVEQVPRVRQKKLGRAVLSSFGRLSPRYRPDPAVIRIQIVHPAKPS